MNSKHGHKSSVICLTKCSDKLILSGSTDASIKLWNLNTDECLKTFEGHTDQINSIEILSDDRIASGSYDKTIKIWNLVEGTCLKTFSDHTDAVMCLKYMPVDKFLVSCSEDETIRIWNLETYCFIKMLEIEKKMKTERKKTKTKKKKKEEEIGVASIEMISDRELWSGQSDGTIKIWEIDSGICVESIYGHSCLCGGFLIHFNLYYLLNRLFFIYKSDINFFIILSIEYDFFFFSII